MAEAKVKSELVIKLCDAAIIDEKETHLETMKIIGKNEHTEWEHLDSIGSLQIPDLGIAIRVKNIHFEKIIKLRSIRNLASLSEEITLNDSDCDLLNIKEET